MTIRTTIAVLLCLVPVTAISGQEELSTALGRWTAALPVDTRIADEVGRFVHDGRIDLSEGYRSTFAARMRALVAREADRAIATLASRPEPKTPTGGLPGSRARSQGLGGTDSRRRAGSGRPRCLPGPRRRISELGSWYPPRKRDARGVRSPQGARSRRG